MAVPHNHGTRHKAKFRNPVKICFRTVHVTGPGAASGRLRRHENSSEAQAVS